MANNWLTPSHYRKVYKFIGYQTTAYLGAGILIGIAQFFVELVFALVLKTFLSILGIIPSDGSATPSWIPTSSVNIFLLFLSGVLIFRGLLLWLYSYFTSASAEIQRDVQRYRLAEWALRSTSVSSALVVNLFNEGTFAMTAVTSNVLMIAVQSSTSLLIWAYLLKISWITTLLVTAAMFTIGIIMRILDAPIRQEGERLSDVHEQVNAHILNSIKNLLLIQIYGTQNIERDKIHHRLSSMLKSVLKFQKFLYLKFVMPQTLGLVVICGVSAVAVKHSWLSSSAAVAYFYLFVRFVQSFSESIKSSSTVRFHLPNSLKLAKWWSEHAHDGLRNPVTIASEQERPHFLDFKVGWQVRNLNFSYPGAHNKILDNFSMEVRPGTATVITGESGCGKSTLLALLLGNLTPSSGDICIWDGHSIAQPLLSVRPNLLRSIGYVGPESFLIEGTVLDNLLYGTETKPSEAELAEILGQAECQFIFELQGGLNHLITEQGQGLSAGQKQRLCLARALIRKPKVLILDEATANLDGKTEARLVQTLLKLKGSTTIIAVTHRDAILQIADNKITLGQ
jgi:ABC-type multidrug transport system fused ATPase/permease subunit